MDLKEALNRKALLQHMPVGAMVRNLNKIRGRVDGISVSEAALDGIVGDNIKTCEILQTNRFQAIYQTTTREKNRLQLQKDLMAAHEAGVENLLVFTEDYRII